MSELSVEDILKNAKGSAKTEVNNESKPSETPQATSSTATSTEQPKVNPDEFKGKINDTKESSKSSNGYELISEGTYIAKLLEITKGKAIDFKTKKEIDKFSWKFEIVDGEYKGKKITKKTNTYFSEKSNTVKYYQKIMNAILEDGDDVNIMDCIGKQCRIKVSKSGDSGKEFNYVKDILTYKGS